MQCTLPPRCTLNPTGKSMCWAVQTMGCSTSFRFPTLCMSHSLFSVNWRLRFDSICTFTLQTTDTHTHSPFRYNYRSSASPTTSPSPVPTTPPSAFFTNQPAVSPTTSDHWTDSHCRDSSSLPNKLGAALHTTANQNIYSMMPLTLHNMLVHLTWDLLVFAFP